jgi:hypothetical protein
MVSLLDEVLQDLILKLGHQGFVYLKIYEAMAKICFKAIGYLQEILGLSKLVLLDLQYLLQKFISILILMRRGPGCGRLR